MKNRVIVIGMDSAPLSLLLPWIRQGELPAIGRILEEGACGDLYSRIPVTPVAWSSIYTGKNPGKHGILGFRNHKQGTYDDLYVNSTLRDSRDVWEIAGSYGKKVIVVNTPLTYPPRPANGYLVCGFMAPGAEYDFTYPKELGAEIRRVVPGYRIGTQPVYIKGLYLKELNRTVEMVGDATLHLMKKTDWDLTFVVFKETDEVQHSFFDRPRAMLSVYQKVDEYVAAFTKEAGDDAHVFIVSDHGGEAVYKRFNVAEFMRREGLIQLNAVQRNRSSGAFQLLAQAMFGLKLQWVLDLPGSRRLLSQLMKARAKSGGGGGGFYGGTVDWDRTKAFISAGIGLRINMKGREPKGIVDPSDYAEIRDRIAKELAAIVDPERNEKVFKYAVPREEILSGPHTSEAPDILCLPNTGYLPTESLASFDPIAVAATHRSLFSRSTLWSGTHSPTGVVAIAGPEVGRSKLNGATLDDIAPTVLFAMGLPVPDDVDGRVLTEAFNPEFVQKNPVRRETPHLEAEARPSALSEEEERKVEERLRQLGYV